MRALTGVAGAWGTKSPIAPGLSGTSTSPATISRTESVISALAGSPARVTWVVPPHFERALASGFPYPDAQWSVTLNVGARNGIWDYRLISDERRIVVQGTGLRFRSLDIRLTGISGIDWSQLAPQAHLCRTPYLTPTSMTHWAENLAALLVG